MQTRRFIQCDVFTPTPTLGNALAVVVDGDGLDDITMHRFAAWLHCGGQSKQAGFVRQECGVGIVEIDSQDPGHLAFVAPPTEIRPMQADNFEAIVEALQISRQQILHSAELDNGPVWQAFQLDSADSVLALDSARVRWPEFKAIGLIGAHADGGECQYEVRMLAPSSGMSEDPITGSLNSALAHWLQSRGQLTQPVTVAQGTRIERHGRVSIRPRGDGVMIGGQTHILIEGEVQL